VYRVSVRRLRAPLVALVSSALVAAACHRSRPAWFLLHPPEVRDDSYPKGYHLLTAAPLDQWRRVAAFDSEAACVAARQRNLDDSIDRARAEKGDDAKYDLTVRRAVNAVCVTPERR
jgi:hypothetical protein